MTATVARLKDLQFRLEYALLRTIVAGVRAVPLDRATAFSARWWRRLAPIVSPKRHKRALANLAIAFPDKTPQERERLARLAGGRPRGERRATVR